MVKPTSISEEIIASIFRAEGPDVGGVTFRRTAYKITLHHNPEDHTQSTCD